MKRTIGITAIFLMVLGNVNCLSMKFAATASPLNTLKYAGQSSFRTSCDTNEKCKFETNDKAECVRVGCCWNDILNSCSVMKIHFEKLCSGDSCETKYQHWFVNQDEYFDDARQYCRDTHQGDIIQYDPKLLTMEGRSELMESLGITADFIGSTYANIKIGIQYDASSGTWKRVGNGEDVILQGWYSGAPRDLDLVYIEWFFNSENDDYHNYVYNFTDWSEPFICERAI